MIMKYDLVATLSFLALMNADLTFRIQAQSSLLDYCMNLATLQTLGEPDVVCRACLLPTLLPAHHRFIHKDRCLVRVTAYGLGLRFANRE